MSLHLFALFIKLLHIPTGIQTFSILSQFKWNEKEIYYCFCKNIDTLKQSSLDISGLCDKKPMDLTVLFQNQKVRWESEMGKREQRQWPIRRSRKTCLLSGLNWLASHLSSETERQLLPSFALTQFSLFRLTWYVYYANTVCHKESLQKNPQLSVPVTFSTKKHILFILYTSFLKLFFVVFISSYNFSCGHTLDRIADKYYPSYLRTTELSYKLSIYNLSICIYTD